MKKFATLFIILNCLFYFSHAQHITNNGGQIMVNTESTLVIYGNILNQTDGSMDNSGEIKIAGNWTNKDPGGNLLQGTTGKVTFNGNTAQAIEGPGKTWFNELEIQNHVDVNTEISVSSGINLVNGKVILNTGDMVMESGAVIDGVGPDQYIVAESSGRLIQEVGTVEVLFPVGSLSSYVPVTLNNSGVMDNIGICVFNDVLDGGTTGNTIQEIDNCVNNTWIITEETPGGSALGITAQWNGMDEGSSFDRTKCGLGHFSGVSWDGDDEGAAAGSDPYMITRTGITALSAFAVGDVNSPMVSIDYNNQNIFLFEGWSGISSYLEPADENVEAIFDPIVNEFIIVQNESGFYWPAEGVNTIGDWDVYSGYAIKLLEDVTLTITGLDVTDKTVDLEAGWNLIPVLSKTVVDAESLMTGVNGFRVAKEVIGNGILWPQYGIKTLANLYPGKAYYMNMTMPGSMTYTSKSVSEEPYTPIEIVNITPWNDVHESPGNHLVVFIQEVVTHHFMPSDYIGAFTPSGLCAGMTMVTEQGACLVLNKDDLVTGNTDGFITGETITYKLYRPENNQLFDLEVTYDPSLDNNGRFNPHGLSAVTGIILAATEPYDDPYYSGINIFPNPSDGVFNILSKKADITVFNSQGQVVHRDKVDGNATLDLTHLGKGFYYIRFNTGVSITVKKIGIN